MFLSKIELNPRCKQVQAELRDPYQMHRTLSKAFGDDNGDYKDARCLFRVDESNEGRSICLLMQSKVQPNWESWTTAPEYQITEPKVKEFKPVLKAGQRLVFKLRANPTVKRDGKRLGIYTEPERLAWLERKGETNGFRVLEANIASDGKQKSRTTNGSSTAFSAAIFNGILEITDVEKFMEALSNGIGSAKGFGFGLLSVARVK